MYMYMYMKEQFSGPFDICSGSFRDFWQFSGQSRKFCLRVGGFRDSPENCPSTGV